MISSRGLELLELLCPTVDFSDPSIASAAFEFLSHPECLASATLPNFPKMEERRDFLGRAIVEWQHIVLGLLIALRYDKLDVPSLYLYEALEKDGHVTQALKSYYTPREVILAAYFNKSLKIQHSGQEVNPVKEVLLKAYFEQATVADMNILVGQKLSEDEVSLILTKIGDYRSCPYRAYVATRIGDYNAFMALKEMNLDGLPDYLVRAIELLCSPREERSKKMVELCKIERYTGGYFYGTKPTLLQKKVYVIERTLKHIKTARRLSRWLATGEASELQSR